MAINKHALQAKIAGLENKPTTPKNTFLNLMWDETCQQESEHRMALAFYVGWRVYGDTMRNWPTIDPDTWCAAHKAFKKFFAYPRNIRPEHLELLLRLTSDPQNFSGAHTPEQCWEEVFGSCPYPKPTPGTTEPEAAPVIRPTPVSLNTPVTKAPGF